MTNVATAVTLFLIVLTVTLGLSVDRASNRYWTAHMTCVEAGGQPIPVSYDQLICDMD